MHGAHDQMTARRRRGGSESEQAPLILASGGSYSLQDSWSQQTQAHHHANKAAGYSIEDIIPVKRENISIGTMTSRDRTTEFVNAIRSLQGRHVKRTMAVRDPRKAKYIQSYAEFMMIAR